MTAVEKYNALDGRTVSREELEEIMNLGDIQGQEQIVERIKGVLENHPDLEFQITVSETAIDILPAECLNGLECLVPDEEFQGLEKAVSPDQIYQMITDKMLAKLKEATGRGYKKKWKQQSEPGYLIPFNFESKKQYRGINIALLTDGMTAILPNPYFLTFKQIEKFKGKLKKGSKGLPVVYFTMLYSVSEVNANGEKIEFGTYDKKKYLAWLTKNVGRLIFDYDYYKNKYIPILKYYNVFNGADVEGIDFKLDDFKIGFQNGSETIIHNDPRVEIADLIIENYPKPQPKLKDSTKGAFFQPAFDVIGMPKFESFETGLDYYRTLFHEYTHSTGISSRMNRDLSGRFGSKSYAKEELVAEFGAVFLSAHAGIIWYNQKNHAEYLKNWNNVLTMAKEDNRFFMRAASKAQEAADFVLNPDNNGVPAYQNSLKREFLKKAAKNPRDVSELRAKSIKEYNRKIELLDGYLLIEEKLNQAIEKLNQVDHDDKHKGVLEKEVEKLENAISIQVDQAAKFFKITDNAFIDILELYSEDKTKIKMKLRPTSSSVKNNEYTQNQKKQPKKGKQLKMALAAPWHSGAAKEALSDCGRLKKGYKYTKGGQIVKVEKKKPVKKTRVSKPKVKPVPKAKKTAVKKTPTPKKPKSKKDLDKVNPKPFSEKPQSVAVSKSIQDILALDKYQGINQRQAALLYKYFSQYNTLKFDDYGFSEEFAKITSPYDEGLLMKETIYHFLIDNVNLVLTHQGWDLIQSVKNRLESLRNQKNNYAMFEGLKSPELIEPYPTTVPVAAVAAVATVPTVVSNPPGIMNEEELLAYNLSQGNRRAPIGSGAKSLADSMREPQVNEIFNVPGDIGRFLGKVERKPVHSVVATLDAEQGAGKTRIFFRVMNVLAGAGYKCLFISLEEHPASKLFKDKVEQYIDPQNLGNIAVIDEVENWNKIRSDIERADIIFIDSFQKLPPNIDLDQDIRKAFNGKWFHIIYQQTGTKGMRGGSKAAFDGDQILKVFKDPEDYRNNYVFANKNRYNDAPDLKLNIFTGKLMEEPGKEIPKEVDSRDPIPKPTGRLIVTPIE